MKGFMGKSVVRMATLVAAVAAVGCSEEAGLCYFPEQEEIEELTRSECTERGGTWEPVGQIVGV